MPWPLGERRFQIAFGQLGIDCRHDPAFDYRACGWNTPLRHAATEGAGGKHGDRVPFPIRGRVQLLAGDAQDRIGLVWIFLQRLDSFACRQYGQFDFAAMRFALQQ